MGVGICCFVLGGLLIFTMPKQPIVAMLPIFLAYAFMVVGAYRAAFGRTPEPAHPGEMSLKRIAFAVTTIVVVIGALLGLVFLGEHLYVLLQQRS
jgi:hypothetical protein